MKRVNELIAYHGPVARALTAERTALESPLIPVTAYIVVACAEAHLRYPDLVAAIDRAMPAEEIGRRARRPGCQVDTCFLWSIANFPLVGRKAYGMIAPDVDDADRLHRVLDFWERAALAYRADGTRLAWDNGVARPYGAPIMNELLAGVAPVDDADTRRRLGRLNATLVSHLFLLYFDTRAGYCDSGPYPVPGHPGRSVLVRDYYRLAQSDFWWSEIAAGVPYRQLTAAFVLDGVDFRITDFGTSVHTPEDWLEHLVGFGLYAPDDHGALTPVPESEYAGLEDAVRRAQAAHYRALAAMSRDAKIRCGAYVYFSFLRPFAVEAGIESELDWTVPRDLPGPLYEFMSAIEGNNAPEIDESVDYYALYPEST